MFYKQQNFFKDTNIRHGFFGRNGGVSTGNFASLNISPYSGDDNDNILKNISVIEHEFKGKACLLKQVHGNKCITIKNINDFKSDIQADAMVTDLKNIILMIQTADCCPVLFKSVNDKGDSIIGAAHAGWGGALNGIIENTIDAMVNMGCCSSSITAVIGPTISSASYEVSIDFLKAFTDHDKYAEKFFKHGRNEKLYFDLPAYILWRLSSKSLANIYDICEDTYKNNNEYFSYRRSCHNNESSYGRQASVIVIES